VTTVLRCDVCQGHSASWGEKGWHKVTPTTLVRFPVGEKDLCPACWTFLVDNRLDMENR